MTWKKSTFTDTNQCVELRHQGPAIRDSKHKEVIMSVDHDALNRLVKFVQVRPM